MPSRKCPKRLPSPNRACRIPTPGNGIEEAMISSVLHIIHRAPPRRGPIMSRRMPTVRQISWLATIPQCVALAVAVGVGWAVIRSRAGVLLGIAVYLAYSFGSRAIVLRHHRRGLSLARQGRYEEAIRQFTESHEIFVRHAWVDRFRALFLMSPSAMSCREMSLVNIAYCYVQLGNGLKAKEYYERALQEFPESSIARSALRLIESVQESSDP